MIKMTAAFKKIQDYRDSINLGRAKIVCKNLSCVVYLYSLSDGTPVAVGYVGRQRKHSLHSSFQSNEQRTNYINRWIEERREIQERTKPQPRLLKAGDILRNSWGYEQTNIDYYLVTRLVGKMSVEVVKIGQIKEHGDMQGTCVPNPSKVIGEPMTKKVDGLTIRLSTGIAKKINYELVNGSKVYKPDHYSSYH